MQRFKKHTYHTHRYISDRNAHVNTFSRPKIDEYPVGSLVGSNGGGVVGGPGNIIVNRQPQQQYHHQPSPPLKLSPQQQHQQQHLVAQAQNQIPNPYLKKASSR